MRNRIRYVPYYMHTTSQHNINHSNEERFIPFIGGALIGGALGSAYSRPRYYGPVYPMYGYYPYVGYNAYNYPTYSSGYTYQYSSYPRQ